MADHHVRGKPNHRPRLGGLLVALLAWGMTWGPAGTSLADALTSRQAKRLDSQAEKALERGDLDAARSTYLEIVEGSGLSEPLRADALWYLALDALALHDDPEQGAAAADEYLHTLLEEHTAFPRRAQARALGALLGQVAELGRQRREAARCARNLAEREEEIATATAQLAELEESDAEAKSSLETSVADLRSRLSEARRAKDLCEGDLKKKEEALQKLKDALVGGGG